ncbi:MAG: hypothetical protein ABIF08_01280 [Nanoarchaeota archaeon]
MAEDKEQIEKKMKEGWIKTSMMIELLAADPDKTKEFLEKHVEKIEKEDKIILYRKDFKEVIETTSPFPNVPKAYSGIVEIELVAETLDKIVYIVMNYGPTNVEILEPTRIAIDMGEAQGIVNSVSTMMHKFAAAGVGGIITS